MKESGQSRKRRRLGGMGVKPYGVGGKYCNQESHKGKERWR